MHSALLCAQRRDDSAKNSVVNTIPQMVNCLLIGDCIIKLDLNCKGTTEAVRVAS